MFLSEAAKRNPKCVSNSYLPKRQTAGFSEELYLFLFFFSIGVPVGAVGAGRGWARLRAGTHRFQAGGAEAEAGGLSVGPRIGGGTWEHRWTRSREGGRAGVQGQQVP